MPGFENNQLLNNSLSQQAGFAMGALPFKNPTEGIEIGGAGGMPPTPPPSRPIAQPAPAPTPQAPSQPAPSPQPAPQPEPQPQVQEQPQEPAVPKFKNADEADRYVASISQGDDKLFLRNAMKLGLVDKYGNGRGVWQGDTIKTPAMAAILNQNKKPREKWTQKENADYRYAQATSYADALFDTPEEKLAYIQSIDFGSYSGERKMGQKDRQLDMQERNIDSSILHRENQDAMAEKTFGLNERNVNSQIEYRANQISARLQDLDIKERDLQSKIQYRQDLIKNGADRIEIQRANTEIRRAGLELQQKKYGDKARLAEEKRIQVYNDQVMQIDNELRALGQIEDILSSGRELFVTGGSGKLLSEVKYFGPSTDAGTLLSLTATVKDSMESLRKLCAMKSASPNGASGLGNTSNREFQALSETVTNLNPSGNHALFVSNVKHLKQQLTMIRAQIIGGPLANGAGYNAGLLNSPLSDDEVLMWGPSQQQGIAPALSPAHAQAAPQAPAPKVDYSKMSNEELLKQLE